MAPLGLIAGAGALPLAVAHACVGADRPPFLVRLAGFADAALADFDGVDIPIGELGAAMAALRGAACGQLCFAGHVGRPDLRDLRIDDRGRQALPRALAAARRGNGALLSVLVAEFEAEGFEIVGAHEAAPGLLLANETPTVRAPTGEEIADVARAMSVARGIGALDVGQAAVCRDGRVLAVEAEEGTDAMVRRAGELIGWGGSGARDRRGVLAKVPKPIQDKRIDLPVIGLATVEAAAAAGLAGIVGEAKGVLLLQRNEAVRLADQLGLFVAGWAEEIDDVS